MTWDDLRVLRERGQKPRLALFVTTDERFAYRMLWVGAAAILHKPGAAMPVELLDGLDVIIDAGNCERSGAVKRLMDQRGVTPGQLRTWCRCSQSLAAVALPCDEEGAWLAA